MSNEFDPFRQAACVEALKGVPCPATLVAAVIAVLEDRDLNRPFFVRPSTKVKLDALRAAAGDAPRLASEATP